MKFTITMVTFDDPIKTLATSGAGQYRPAVGTTSFADAKVTQFQIEDDEQMLHYIKRDGSLPYIEKQQTLLADLPYGANGEILPAGSQISAYHASIIQDQDGNQFHYLFLWTPDGSARGVEMLGGRHSAILLPIARQDAEGNSIWPEFDPTANFTKSGEASVGTSYPGYATGPADEDDSGNPPCFTPGTLIDTANGPVLIEQLRINDLIVTRDHGLQPIRWIGATKVSSRRLDLQPNLRPILIPANALAAGIPARDLMVSPQHRMLVQSRIALRMFEQTEVLVAAKHLLGMNGIKALHPADGVTYLHILFDRHEVIRSDGAWSESFFVGPQMIHAGDRAIMAEITSLFPDLIRPEPARRLLSGRESRQLTMRHVKNRRALAQAQA